MFPQCIRHTHAAITRPVDFLSGAVVIPPQVTFRVIRIIVDNTAVQFFKVCQIQPVIGIHK